MKSLIVLFTLAGGWFTALADDPFGGNYLPKDGEEIKVWILSDAHDQPLSDTEYSAVYPFSDGLAAVQKDDLKWGYIDTKGATVIPFDFDQATPFSEGLAVVRKLPKLEKRGEDSDAFIGIIDPYGEIVHKVLYTDEDSMWDDLQPFHEGLAAYRKGRLWGFINTDNEIVIPSAYAMVRQFSDGLAAVRIKGKWGYIDAKGKVQIEPESHFANAGNFVQGMVAFQDPKSKLWGAMDKSGETQVEPEWESIDILEKGYLKVKSGDFYGLLNPEGRTVAPPIFKDFGVMSEGLCAALQVGKNRYGYIDETGEFAIKPLFDTALPFSDEEAFVKRGAYWVVINPQGKPLRKEEPGDSEVKFIYRALGKLHGSVDPFSE